MTALTRFWRREDAGPTVEFVILFPAILAMVFATFEIGWLMTRQMVLDRATYLAVRDVQLGITPNLTHSQLKDLICDHGVGLRNCRTSINVELVNYDPTTSTAPQQRPNCIDRTGTIAPVIRFDPNVREQIMYVRSCVALDLMLPNFGIGLTMPKDASGAVLMTAETAFMTEP